MITRKLRSWKVKNSPKVYSRLLFYPNEECCQTLLKRYKLEVDSSYD